MDEVLDVLFSILPVVIAVLWILRRIGRRSGGRGSRPAAAKQAESAEPSRPAGIRSQRLRDERSSGADRTKTERKSALEKVLARVAELAEGSSDTGRPPGEDELYDRMDHPWPGSRESRPPQASGSRSAAPESVSLLVDLDEDTEAEVVAAGPVIRKAGGPLQRISGLPPLARGILWSEILGKPVGQRRPDDDFL